MTEIKKILLAPSTFGAIDPAPVEKLKDEGFQIIDNPFKRKLTKDELIELLDDDVIGVVAGLEPYDEDVYKCSGLKAVSRCGSGMSNVDIEAAKENDVKITSTPDGPTQSVAELTLGCLLSLMRYVGLMDRSLREGRWNKKIGFLLENKTIAIIGFGKIGRKLSKLLMPFNVKIIVIDPFVSQDDCEYQIMDLKEALPIADIVSLHASGEDCLLAEEELSLVKKGAFILNAARGTLIDEDALCDALEEGRVAGVWLDTYKEEPYKGKLSEFDQAIFTPHVGSYTKEGRKKMEMQAVDNLINSLKGN